MAEQILISNSNELYQHDAKCTGILPKLYLKYVASSLEVDKETRRLTEEQIEDIKKRCDRLSQDEKISTFGEIKSFPTDRILYFYKNYHVGNTKVKHKEAKEDKIESLEKLFLCAKRFVDNFFEDMESSRGEIKIGYQNLKAQICEMYKVYDIKPIYTKDGLIENEFEINENNKKFLRVLEIELTLRIKELIDNEKNHDIRVITAISSMTQYHKMKRFFQNLLMTDFEDLSVYASSKYRENLSSMYSASCEIPDMTKFNEFLQKLSNFSEKELGNKELSVEILKSISGMYHGEGIPTQSEFKTIKEIILACKELDSDNYLNIFRSFTSMLSGKGAKDLNKAKDFLNKFIEYSENELHIKDNKETFKLFSSISGMFAAQGIPSSDEFEEIKGIIKECQSIDSDNYLNIFSSFTSMLGGKGAKDLNKAKDFLNKFIEYSENELHIKDDKGIFKLFSSISGMFNRQGIPSEKEFETIKEIINECKNTDKENYVRCFQNISCKYEGKKVPKYTDLSKFIKEQYQEFKEQFKKYSN